MQPSENPSRPTWKIRAYEVGGLGLFLAGIAVIAASPLFGLGACMMSLYSFSKSTDLDTNYKEVLKTYESERKHPTLYAFA